MRLISARAAAVLLAVGLLAPLAPAAAAAPGRTAVMALGELSAPVVIAHRGASGHRPEETLAAYRLAITMGADFVEPDLVSTRDGVLVARHENELSETTDVADHPEFADRRVTKRIDGHRVTGWFTEDFTLAELRTLRAVERLPSLRPANSRYDGRFRVPTFRQVLALVDRKSERLGRPIGVYPETKHPSYFDGLGLSLEEPLVRALRHRGLDQVDSPVFIQSFETGNLEELDTMIDVPLVQLVTIGGAPYDQAVTGSGTTYRQMVTPEGLQQIATYADVVGANKLQVIPRDPSTGFARPPTRLVPNAHDAELLVHVWTMRDENQFMAKDFWVGNDPDAKGDAEAEVQAFLDQGVDGFFDDYPDTGVRARDAWLAGTTPTAG